MKNLFNIPLLAIILLSVSCRNDNKHSEQAPPIPDFNISILLDLSDRIDVNKHPFQVQIDTESIKTIINIFKDQLNEKGVYEANGKMKIFFYPPPANNDIISIAKNLNVDFSKISNSTEEGIQKRIQLFQSFDSIFMNNTKKLYLAASHNNEYPGADIWTFFKDDIQDQCIEKDSTFRNILVVITDGYIYWESNRRNPIGHRYTYITANTPQVSKFRKLKNWEDFFDKEDYGFVDVKQNLPNLEILVMGIDPQVEEDYGIMRMYWEKWLKEMNIKARNIKIIKTELPVKTNIIENFFQIRN